MFKTGFVLLILSIALINVLPPRFERWEKRDLFTTVPFAIGGGLIFLSFIATAWKYMV